ncbi:unnamed protein product [Cunninghamella echinulata]
MTIHQQNGLSSKTLNRRSILSPPPSYDSIIKENDEDDDQKITEITDPFLDVQKIIKDTYSILHDLQTRLTRIENTNEILATNLKVWTHNRNDNDINRQNELENSIDEDNNNKTLDIMTTTVQQLLEEANNSLNSNNNNVNIQQINNTTTVEESEGTLLSLDHVLRYQTSEQNLDFAFNRLMITVDNYNMISTLVTLLPQSSLSLSSKPIQQQPIEQHIHHTYHHYHYHYHQSQQQNKENDYNIIKNDTSEIISYISTEEVEEIEESVEMEEERSNDILKNSIINSPKSNSTSQRFINFCLTPLQRLTTISSSSTTINKINSINHKYQRFQLIRLSFKIIVLGHFILLRYRFHALNLMKYRWRRYYYRLLGSSKISFIHSYRRKVLLILFTIRFIRQISLSPSFSS